jgi:hypothetical protein
MSYRENMNQSEIHKKRFLISVQTILTKLFDKKLGSSDIINLE